MMYKFQRLLNKYRVKGATTTTLSTVPGYYDTGGDWVPPQHIEKDVELNCAIVPMSTRQINDSGGRYSASDRQLYTQTKLQPKQHIKYKNVTYSVEEETDYTEYSDFFVYVIKAVSPFATN